MTGQAQGHDLRFHMYHSLDDNRFINILQAVGDLELSLPGTLQTLIPRSPNATRSSLSYPTPHLTTTYVSVPSIGQSLLFLLNESHSQNLPSDL